MELQGLGNPMAGGTRLIDHIVGEVKSQGIFDKFRKECIADVDTKPAYQNLRTRVEGSVNSFLNKQTWRTDLNKTQLRETLRKHIHEAPYLEVGVERIVDQVVNPKVYSNFMPKVEDVVYKFLGIEMPKAQRNGTCELKDLLPKDLDPVSPESDRNSLKDASLGSMDMDDETNDAVNSGEQQHSSINVEEKEEKAHVTEAPINKEELVEKEELQQLKQEDDIKKDESDVEKITEEVSQQVEVSSPVKADLNCSFKSDETNKTDEEEEDSPAFEPIDLMNMIESNMSNDSHMSGISELTSHRSRSPDFMTEFSRDNFDFSNQDSQLSKVSSGSRLSIVTDFGSSNHASTPAPDSKDDSKGAKDDFKSIRDMDSSKDKFNFDAIKSKDKENSKISNSSKESSRDASDYRERGREQSRSKSSRDRHDSKNSRERDRDSKRYPSSKFDKQSQSRSKDKHESLDSSKNRDGKSKVTEKKDDTLNEARDLKDLYKEKIRELWEKKELTEKEKLGKDHKDAVKIINNKDKNTKDKKECSTSSREKEDNRRSHKSSSSSSSRSSSYHKSSKDSRDRSSSNSSSNKRDDRRNSNGKSSYLNSRSGKRDSKSDNHNHDSSKKRRTDKKSLDDHSSLRKNFNDRRSSDRDGSNGSSSKYSHKTNSNSSNNRLGPSTSFPIDNNKYHSSGETSDNVHDSLHMMSFGLDNQPRRVDLGNAEICLPLKKRPLQSDESSSSESPEKKPRVEEKKALTRKKVEDVFKTDEDVTSVPDEERVQIIEITEEDYEQPYSDKEEPILSLEETKNIIFNAEPIVNPIETPAPSKLSEMEQSIRDSLSEMMSNHGFAEPESALNCRKLIPVIDSTSSLIETLTDESLEASLVDSTGNIIIPQDISASTDFKDKELEDIETVQKYLNENNPSIARDEAKQLEAMEESGLSELDQVNEYLRRSMEVPIESVGREEIKDLCEDREVLGESVKESKEDEREVDVRTAEENMDINVGTNSYEVAENSNEDENRVDANTKVEKMFEKVVMEDSGMVEEYIDKIEKQQIDVNTEDIKVDRDHEVDSERLEENSKADEDIEVEKMDDATADLDKITNVDECDKESGKEANIDTQIADVGESLDKTSQNVISDMSETKENLEADETDMKSEVQNAPEKSKQNTDKHEMSQHVISDVLEKDDCLEADIVDMKSEIKNTLQESEQSTDKDVEIKESSGPEDQTQMRLVEVDPNIPESEENDIVNDESIDNSTSDECNEDKLMIDEEFDEKDHESIDIGIDLKVKTVDDQENDSDDAHFEPSGVQDDSDPSIDTNSKNVTEFNKDEKNNNSSEENRAKSVENLEENISNIVADDEKLVETNQSHTATEAITKSYDEEEIDLSKNAIENQIEDATISKVGLDEVAPKLVEDDPICATSVKDKNTKVTENIYVPEVLPEKIDIKIEIKQEVDTEDDDNEMQENKLTIVCDESQNDKNKSMSVCENLIDSKEAETFVKIEFTPKPETDTLHSDAVSLGVISTPLIPNRQVESPVEEECRYFENNNHDKYLRFKEFLDKLEANPSKSSKSTVKGKRKKAVPPSVPAAPATQSTLKRKLTPSPLSDNLIANSSYSVESLGANAGPKKSGEDTVVVIKKRKPGRAKKVNSNAAQVVVVQQHQQVESTGDQKPQLLEVLPTPGAVVNGENIMNIDNDGDKNVTVKDDKEKNRSRQRYSSDDLYKPRPLFPSSSRRNRRFNNNQT
ncbi:biorientation of chromosomes in cell division protein 1-like 1 [Copidosoma floridanum]|uniref:biorientation of chromosomes in cell division protein 1-like 1 n=1 Tax=Copidosoma floridanum TaxID=29053 RepID=UPI0006C9A4E1|nr:biorientation of chromosomes in cell division protein 1-like 1 [Copidosoma floridanum]